MKRSNPLLTVLVFCIWSQGLLAQEYIRVEQEEVIYDVDVVVFARRLAQPESETFNNAELVDKQAVRVLSAWDPETPLAVFPEPVKPEQLPETNDQEQWQVPIEEQPILLDALSWIMLSKGMVHPIIDRLEVNPSYFPLIHQKWRQPATPFLNPEYVEVSHPEHETDIHLTEEDVLGETDDLEEVTVFTDFYNEQPVYSDYSYYGKVAFSKQRFSHLHVKMNLFRINANGDQVIHKIEQQKRVELGEWQYFDHQQFGVLAKVTAVEFSREQDKPED